MERIGKCPNIGPCSLSTSEKHQIFTDDNDEFVCTECGTELEPIQEVTNAPIPENGNKTKKVILGAIVAIALIGAGTFFALPKGEENTPPEEMTNTTIVEETPAVKEEIPATTANAKSNTTAQVDGGTYKGEISNGKPDGMGTLTYTKSQLISKRDTKKRTAEAGDYITGEFYNGELVQGKWFDESGNQKGVLMIGKP